MTPRRVFRASLVVVGYVAIFGAAVDLIGIPPKLVEEASSSGAATLALFSTNEGRARKLDLPDLNFPAPPEPSSSLTPHLYQASSSRNQELGITAALPFRVEPPVGERWFASFRAQGEGSSSHAQRMLDRNSSAAGDEALAVDGLNPDLQHQGQTLSQRTEVRARESPSLQNDAPAAKKRRGVMGPESMRQDLDAKARAAKTAYSSAQSRSGRARKAIKADPILTEAQKGLLLAREARIVQIARHEAMIYQVNVDAEKEKNSAQNAKRKQRKADGQAAGQQIDLNAVRDAAGAMSRSHSISTSSSTQSIITPARSTYRSTHKVASKPQ